MIIGGVAVIGRGVPRTTLDIIDLPRVRGLVARFAAALNAPERVAQFEAVLARVRQP